MTERVSMRLRQSLTQRANVVGRHLRCEARARFDGEAKAGPRVWLEALGQDMRYLPVVYLAAPKDAEGFRYIVGTPGDLTEPLRFAFENDAAAAFKTLGIEHGKTLPLHTRRPTVTAQEPPRPTEDAPAAVFTMGEAIGQPLIRATVIAGHEVAKTTGAQWEPLHILTMARAALSVIEVQAPGSSSDPGKRPEVERALVGILVGALAAADKPTPPTAD